MEHKPNIVLLNLLYNYMERKTNATVKTSFLTFGTLDLLLGNVSESSRKRPFALSVGKSVRVCVYNYVVHNTLRIVSPDKSLRLMMMMMMMMMTTTTTTTTTTTMMMMMMIFLPLH